MIESLIVSPIATLIAEFYKDDSKSKLFRAAIRDRLRREVRFNLEVFELLNEKKFPVESILAAMEFSAISELFHLPIPVQKILNSHGLHDSAKAVLEQQYAIKQNKKHIAWAKTINNECELLERIWQRIAVLRVRTTKEVGQGDVPYLLRLMHAFEATLRTE